MVSEPGVIDNISAFKSNCMEKLDIKINNENSNDCSVKGEDLLNLFKIFEERCKRNGKQKNKKELYGYKWIDKATAGTHIGEVSVLAARPGTGKTAFSLNIALNKIIEGAHVKIFSLEMTKESILERVMINLGRVDGLKLRAGEAEEKDFINLINAGEEIIKKNLYIDDKSYKLDEIRAACRYAKNKGILDYVIIDYLQLIECDEKTFSNNEKFEFISRRVKLLAKEMNVPILLLSQLNRATESRSDKTPQLSDLRGSGAIEQDADNVFFLHHMPVDEYIENPDEANIDVILTIAKQRSGISGKNNIMRFYRTYQRFSEVKYIEQSD
jgi:replicative DNA helicase